MENFCILQVSMLVKISFPKCTWKLGILRFEKSSSQSTCKNKKNVLFQWNTCGNSITLGYEYYFIAFEFLKVSFTSITIINSKNSSGVD